MGVESGRGWGIESGRGWGSREWEGMVGVESESR